MSYECYGPINVTGPRADVLRFRKDARRRLGSRLKSELKLSTVELSIEKLFRLCRIPDPAGGLPGDEGIYFARFYALEHWCGFSRARYSLQVKNNEIHELLLPISRCYPALCFVNSQTDDCSGSIVSTYTRRARQARWELPEDRQEAYWKAAAKLHRFRKMENAYLDYACRDDAENGMLKAALDQWDDQVVRVLGRARR
jgi:hypothetical protein